LPTNSATTFTTPDTYETALLIHEQDGSIKAFSNICSHRPYTLVYQSSSQTLFCALHSANFDAKTGAGHPLRLLKVLMCR
jgi:nitrite reductase/ring-hydroxylating ferredoxin subunit